MKFVRSFYKNKLDDEDFFGFISLDSSEQACKDEILLDRRNTNMKMKKNLLWDISKREVDYVFASGSGESSKTIRLESALEKAYEWQNTLVPNFEVTTHNNVYIGPHKWIVCLLGDDIYSINQFRLKHQDRLVRQ